MPLLYDYLPNSYVYLIWPCLFKGVERRLYEIYNKALHRLGLHISFSPYFIGAINEYAQSTNREGESGR